MLHQFLMQQVVRHGAIAVAKLLQLICKMEIEREKLRSLECNFESSKPPPCVTHPQKGYPSEFFLNIPPTMNQTFKHMSLYGTVSFMPPQ